MTDFTGSHGICLRWPEKELGVGMGNLSQHLAIMKKAKILSSCKAGNKVYYKLGNTKILKVFDIERMYPPFFGWHIAKIMLEKGDL